jgi:hypothetical protein
MSNYSDAIKFDVVVRRLLSVSHEEIKRRDKEWHRAKAQKKRKGKRNNDTPNRTAR